MTQAGVGAESAPKLAEVSIREAPLRRTTPHPQTPLRRGLYFFLLPVVTLLVWTLAVYFELAPDYLLPSPYRVFFQTLPQELLKGRILVDASESIRRVFFGVTLATITAVPLGIFLGYWPALSKWTSTIVNAGRVLPPASLIPLAVIWFGIGDAPALFLLWFTCFWPILLNSMVGVQGVQKILRDGALTLGAHSHQIMFTVLLPGALPQIAAGVRLAFGLGWSVVVTSELLAVRNGLGFYIWNARLMFSMDQVFVGIVIIGLIGVLLDALLRKIHRHLFRWQRSITVRT
jgi:ABC-type nitrate/sulfonate/bicarbonate transport system permease component